MPAPTIDEALSQAASSLVPGLDEMHTVERQRKLLTRTLEAAGWPVRNVLLGGPIARGTAIRDPLRVKLFLIADPDASTIEPAKLLEQLHQALQATPSAEETLTRLERSVNVVLPSNLEFVLIPAVEDIAEVQGEGEQKEKVRCLRIPFRGQWVRKPLPQNQQEVVNRADEQAGGLLRPLIRLLKRWNRDHGEPLHPAHLEVLSYGAFSHAPANMLAGLATLLRHLARGVFEACPDPTGIGPRLDEGLPPERRQHLAVLLRNAAELVENARQAADQGYLAEAHQLLRTVLGSVYPQRAVEPVPLFLCLDVQDELPRAEIVAAARVHDPSPEFLRKGPEEPLRPGRQPAEEWQHLGSVVAQLASEARALRRPEGPPRRLFICGLAPLPLFVQLGLELSPWFGEQIFINRRPDQAWDRLPLQAPQGHDQSECFDVVRGLRPGDPSFVRGRVAIFIALAGYTTPVTAIEDFYRTHKETMAGLVEIRSERNSILDERLMPAAATELLLLMRQVRAAYPAAMGVAIFVAGPAPLAYIVGRAINPNVLGSILVANFHAPDYALALRLPFVGRTKSIRPARLRIQTLDVEAFRGFRRQRIEFRPSLTVLVGVNGAGKSSILKALALLLSQLVAELLRDAPLGMEPDDVAVGETRAHCGLTVTLDDEKLVMSQTRNANARSETAFEFTRSPKVMEELRRDAEDDGGTSLPLAVYYSVSRGEIEIPERVRKRGDGQRDRLTEMYESALVEGAADFRAFFQWFREREDLENEEKLSGRAFEDAQLQAVRRAIEGLLPGFRDPRIRRSPLRLVVHKSERELAINQLSDGERSLLALAGDLARRLTEAHPSLSDPLEGAAVVLIDEVDLHLHPAWQRRILGDLRKTFPNVQFIVTTHSPQVLSEVPHDEIILLDDFQAYSLAAPTEGRDTNSILAEVFGVPAHPQGTIEAIHVITDMIDEGRYAEAKERLHALAQKVTDRDPEVSRLQVMLDVVEGIDATDSEGR